MDKDQVDSSIDFVSSYMTFYDRPRPPLKPSERLEDRCACRNMRARSRCRSCENVITLIRSRLANRT